MEKENKPVQRHNTSLENEVKQLIQEAEVLLEELDVEQHAKAGHKPARAKRYKIRVDDRYFIVHQHFITGRGILELAGKVPPESFILTEKVRGGGLRTIGLDESVELWKHGLERFTTLPRQVQEGLN